MAKYPFDVFLSHSWARDSNNRDNHQRVKNIEKRLSQAGLTTWFDEDQFGPGDPIIDKMVDGIRESKVVLIFITKAYLKKASDPYMNNIRFEFQTAMEKRKTRVMPIVMESSFTDPTNWEGMVGNFFGRGHFFSNFSGDRISDNEFKKLVRKIRGLSSRKTTTRSSISSFASNRPEFSVCLLGNTGTGKSSLANLLYGRNVFKTGDGGNAGNTECVTHIIENGSNAGLEIIDTPGMNDSRGQDMTFANRIAQALRERKRVGSILLVQKSSQKRLEMSIQAMLGIFIEMFVNKGEFRKNLAVVFTHWDNSDAAEKKRMNGAKKFPKQTEIAKIFNDSVKERLPELRGDTDIPCFFIDNYLDEDDPTYSETERQNNEIRKLLHFVREKNKEPVDCRHFKDVEKERAQKKAAKLAEISKKQEMNEYDLEVEREERRQNQLAVERAEARREQERLHQQMERERAEAAEKARQEKERLQQQIAQERAEAAERARQERERQREWEMLRQAEIMQQRQYMVGRDFGNDFGGGRDMRRSSGGRNGLGATKTTGIACKNCSSGRGCRWAGQGRPGHH
mmetsp:Transcript_15824/g.20253  ORF Transcript_15824/g.20253 Transcript_15824/m.20253 type:complete len:568 (-) Transcript_15824:323-2026(-)